MSAGTAGPPRTSPKAIKFLFGGLAGMGATVFVQPLDLVKNRMQLSGEGAKTKEYKTSFHAVGSILRNEGLRGIYTGDDILCHFCASMISGLVTTAASMPVDIAKTR
ncbi:hypothetical protein GDO86_018800 [Hymenochirus boettgeri]|uniref:Uncharacterized protein n=1 Tax=Hymenochirus boettgeri TaxID=247094 RepID=A0A8T2I9Y5_9PIPI|nr:hypothetical protein GDO86_018800 [Hymenochirus boettgeri]